MTMLQDHINDTVSLLAQFPDTEILAADNLLGQPSIGWILVRYENENEISHEFSIPMVELKAEVAALEPVMQAVFRACLHTPQGRNVFLQILRQMAKNKG